ncbi:SMI1/KNR4 family protein [Providencia sp. Me31A]|uniref:SMI1/KNR4 family protein n=1 Tax=Providencia sp. Me31A TaxID=3392637 RepID=UPI003D29F9F4
MGHIYSREDVQILHQWKQINRQYPNAPLERIRHKLPLVQQVDGDLETFGASSHKYQLNPPIALSEIEKWQARTGAKLPSDFVSFLTEIGNGGAGPYYGIERFEDSESRFEKTAALPSILSPNMSQEEWQKLTFLDDDCSDEEFDERENYIHQGIFYLGTCGCEYDLLLVITGEYVGRIIYTNHWCSSDQPFFFSYELSFLEWYERWLDEIIQGYETSWFGHRIGGDEQTLFNLYMQTHCDEQKSQALAGLSKLKRLSNNGLVLLANIIQEEQSTNAQLALKILAQYSPSTASTYLMTALNSRDLSWQNLAISTIYFNQKGNLADYKDCVLELIKSVEDAEFICFAGYILKELGVTQVEYFAHLFEHANLNLARTALHSASFDDEIEAKIALFYPSIISDDGDMAVLAIQTLVNLNTVLPDAIPLLERAWKKFPKEKNEYVRINIQNYLRKFSVVGDFS